MFERGPYVPLALGGYEKQCGVEPRPFAFLVPNRDAQVAPDLPGETS